MTQPGQIVLSTAIPAASVMPVDTGGPQNTVAKIGQGTLTVNGTSTITVVDANITANSMLLFTLKTVGGSVGATPSVLTITPGTGFAVVATSGDTSVYNYLRIN